MSSGGPTELASRLSGSVVFTDACDLLGFQRDCSVVRPGDADLAIRPRSTEEVQTALAAAYDERTPVYVRGGGSMYAGGVNPHAGGLVVDTGELHASVIDLHWNDGDIALLDASASTHMPDVLEVPYRPDVIDAGEAGERAKQAYPLDRLGEPGDIGRAALWLAADAQWMTGQTIVIDGGALVAFPG